MSATGSGSDGNVFGKLGSVSLHDLIQMLSMGRRTATLTLEHDLDYGHMYFRDGQILHASAGPFEGEDGIIELLQWQNASFWIEDGIESLPKITIGKPVDAVLLGTLTRLDRMNRSDDVVWTPADSEGLDLDLNFADPDPPDPRAQSERRFPPRPSKGRTTHFNRSLWLATGLVGAAGLSTVSFLLAPNATAAIRPWISEPWNELPEIQTEVSVLQRPVAPNQDAWSALAETEELGSVRSEAEPPPPVEPSRPSRAHERAPAPPSVSAPAFLTVVVEPWGRVSIDGRLIGETPLSKQELAPGEHRVTLENDHVAGLIEERFTVQPGDDVVRRYSFRDTGSLQFVVEPWANVRVDGRLVGQTPLGRVQVPIGAHTVVFEHPQFGRHERRVQVRLGDQTLVKHDWRQRP